MSVIDLLPVPRRDAKYYEQGACICLCVREHYLTNKMLPLAVAPTSSEGVAIFL